MSFKEIVIPGWIAIALDIVFFVFFAVFLWKDEAYWRRRRAGK